MTPFEYILPLVSVIVGLAVADLAVSLQRLLRARRHVRWDWLPLATALLAVLALLEVWWIFYASQEADFFTTLGGFLPLAAQLVLLFLLNAAALPDAVPTEGIDLRAFYNANGSYFWTLYAVYVAFVITMKVVGIVGSSTPGEMGIAHAALALVPNFVLLVLFVILAKVRLRTLHVVAVLALLGLFLAQWSGLRLGVV